MTVYITKMINKADKLKSNHSEKVDTLFRQLKKTIRKKPYTLTSHRKNKIIINRK